MDAAERPRPDDGRPSGKSHVAAHRKESVIAAGGDKSGQIGLFGFSRLASGLHFPPLLVAANELIRPNERIGMLE